MILSVSIINQAGSPLVARQFNHFSRSQLEGHLSAFTKLLSNSSQSYIETETIRYVFQAIGELYFILITTKDSNIIEDLDVLALLLDLTCSVLNVSGSQITEDIVYESSFELIFAYDECIFDGYYQDVSVADVSTFLEMKSQEENEFIRERTAKEEAAAAQLRKIMKDLEDKRKAKKEKPGLKSSYQPPPQVIITPTIEPEIEKPKMSRRHPQAAKGMALGRKTTARDRAQQMIKEEGLTVEERRSSRNAAAQEVVTAPIKPNCTVVKLTEITNAKITPQGTVKELAIEGRLTAESSDEGQYGIKLSLFGNYEKFKTRALNQKDRRLFQKQNMLIFDNKGSETALLGWRYTSVNPDDSPLTFSCWVTDGKDDQGRETSTFSCEVSLNSNELTFQSIVLAIPVARARDAKISSVDGEIDTTEKDTIKWIITDIDAENSAELEFSVPKCNEMAFYPIDVEFQSNSLYFNVDVTSVTKGDNGSFDFDNPAKYEVVKSFTTAEFLITSE
ncbi:archain 1b [Tritrichomonas foetus]|uniref:Coatomer subunit delta n=1 Tax=Tritrichomonas foetus TaxID=1144522 RepID=A0A1J4JPW2_9EUKA|nr:archain 1b [Tritrichomonas foetus]|eukprot:OHT00456.1 archain 1b [Tritrichomonas foetus]